MSSRLQAYWTRLRFTIGMSVLASIFVTSHVAMALHTLVASPDATDRSPEPR
jgi:hypothetical protein